MNLAVALVILAAFVLRIVPRMVRPYAVPSDTYYHLSAAEGIRRNRFRIPRFLPGYGLRTPFDYPPLFHYLLACLPKSLREKSERYWGPCIDTFRIPLLYFGTEWAAPGWLSPRDRFWLAILIATSPALLQVGTGPRAYQATPRTLAELLFDATLLTALWSLHQTSPFAAILPAISGGLLLLTSKFSLQILLPVSVAAGLAGHSPGLAALPLTAAMAATLLSRGYYLRVLRGQVGHLYFFKTVTSRKYPGVFEKNRLQDLLHLPTLFRNSPGKAARVVFQTNSYLIAAIRHPALWMLPILLLGGTSLQSAPSAQLFVAVTLGALAAFLLTSLRPFLFLGEPERYLDHAALGPLALVVSLTPSTRIVGLILGYQLLIYAAYFFLFLKLFPDQPEQRQARAEAAAFLRNHREPLRILSIGPTYELAYTCGHEILFPSGNYSAAYMTKTEFDSLYVLYGYPPQDWRSLMRRYKLNAVYASKSTLQHAGSIGIRYDFVGVRPAYENDQALIFLNPGNGA
ncbi:MAG: hypothetical protein HYT87_04360 [Nitrospirae bacterium]|nr:hypothetical protein [Nitrospirota bacterium]